jgi:hypothetical protein
MRELANKIEEFARRKKQRRILAGASTLLALAVIAIVMMSLTKPAISLSETTDNSNIETNFVIKDAINLDGKISNPTIKDNPTIVDENTVKAKVEFTYTLDSKSTVSKDTENKYVYLTLDDDISAIGDSRSGVVIDADYKAYVNSHSEITTGIESGDYYINDEGIIIIKFRDAYLAWLDSNGVQSGTFTLEANFTRGSDKNVNQYDYNIGGAEVTIGGFYSYETGISKSGSDLGDGKFSWQINVNNPAYVLDSSYTITDGAFAEVESVTVSYEDGSVTIPTNGTNSISCSNLPTKSDDSYYSYYSITYETNVDYQSGSYNKFSQGYETKEDNTVTLTGPEFEKSAKGTVTHTSKVSLTKQTGKYDYDNGTVSFNIIVSNPDGLNLDGMTFSDDAFKTLNDGSISVSGASDVDLPNFDCSDVENGNIKVEGECRASAFTIIYTAKLDETPRSQGKENKVTLEDKSSQTLATSSSWYTLNTVTVDKQGKPSRTNEEITWEITVTTQQSGGLNGYTLSDNMLQYAIDGEITTNSDEVNLVKNEDGTYAINSTDNSVKSVKITYTTPFYESDTESNGGIKSGDTITYDNTATVKWDGKETIDKYTVKVAPLNDVSKELKSSTEGSNYDTFTANWSVTLKEDSANYKSGYEFTDEFNIPTGFTLNDNTISNLKLIGEDENNQKVDLNLNEDYTCQFKISDDGTKGTITIKFDKNSAKLDNMQYCTITYTTDFAVDPTKADAGTDVYITNTATFRDESATATAKYYQPDFSKAPYTKTVDGQSSLELTTADLSAYKVTVDGVEYYQFDYVISLPNSADWKIDDKDKNFIITDILPENFQICTETIILGAAGGKYNWLQYGGLCTQNGQKITLSMYDNNWSFDNIYYSARVERSVIDDAVATNGYYEAKNIVKHSNYPEVEQVISVEPKLQQDEGVVEKSGSQQENNSGYYDYTIVVNKDGEDLVGGNGTLTIVDDIICDTYYKGTSEDNKTSSSGDNTEFDLSLSSINVYKMDASGNKGDKITDGWSYSLVNHPVETSTPTGTTTIIKKEQDNDTNVSGYHISGMENETYIVTVYAIDETSNSGMQFQTYTNSWGSSVGVDWNQSYWDGFSDGVASKTITTSSNGGDLWISISQGENAIKYLSIAGPDADGNQTVWGTEYTTTTALAELTVTGLPDETPLIIEYTYSAQDEEANASTTAVYRAANVTNTAQLLGSGYGSSDDGYYVVSNSSQASSTGNAYMKLEKVDVGDYRLTLSAGFHLEKYDSSTKTWLQAVSYTTSSSNGNEVITPEFHEGTCTEILKEDDTELNLNLEEGVLYRLTEYAGPDELTTDTDDNYFGPDDQGEVESNYVFYFCFKSKPNEMPDGVTDCQVITSGGSYTVKNVQKVDVTVTKEWIGLESKFQNSAAAKFALYRTTSISADETQYERVDLSSYSNLLDITGNASINTGENVIILTGEGASIKVKDLPNGEENNGSAYYYVIKEVSYSLNGTKWYTVNSTSEFQPVYSGNFTNGDSTITVTNTKDLVVKKVWKKADGTEITDSTELSAMPSIKFKLYRAIKTKAKQTREDIIENGECIGTYELNSNNDYTYPFTTSNLDGYISGTEYVYAVEEVTNLTNYDVAYRSTTSDGVNVITITNKSTTTEEYVLPSTGSVGTRKLLIAGIALVGFGLAAVGIKLKRRNYEN